MTTPAGESPDTPAGEPPGTTAPAGEALPALPPLYERWIHSLLSAPAPHEPRSTCGDCAMCAPEGQLPQAGGLYFSPHVKCCSYQPVLPNFLVGRALADRDFAFAAGRATLEQRIARRVGLTPLGLDRSARAELLYKSSPESFGRSGAPLCPHFLDEGGGRCGIWRHRNAVCSTYFCKHERGGIGFAFWQRLRDLLSAVESSLATWCVIESDLDPAAVDLLFPIGGRASTLSIHDLNEAPDPRRDDALWGTWHGREREFFTECSRRVEALEWSDVERIGGASIALHARITAKAFERLGSEELPARLVPGMLAHVSVSRDAVRVSAYRETDPLDLDPMIMTVLPYFDGRPTAVVLRTVEEELGIRVEEDLVRRLADFGILRESD